jgi:hypothetical protein
MMLSRDELKEISKDSGLRANQQEKDYVQMLALFHIYRRVGRELIFKGGTALEKVYGLNRFSEDLDFTKNGKVDMEELLEKLTAGMRNYGVDCQFRKDKTLEKSEKYKLNAKGPLFERETSRVFLRLEISIREKPLMEPEIKGMFPKYRDIPNFSLAAMPMREIGAEKVRAILTRDKARDIYDLWFLLKKGVEIDDKMVENKLSYYGTSFSSKDFHERIQDSRKSWESELSVLVPLVPSFEEVEAYIMKHFEK